MTASQEGAASKTATLEEELNTLKASLAEKEQALAAQTEALTQSLEEQAATVAQAEETQKNAEQMTADLTNSKEELASLQAKVKELEEEIARLKEQLGQQAVQHAAQTAVQEAVPAEVLKITQASQNNAVQQAPIEQEAQESASLDNDNDGNVDTTIILSGVNFTVGTANLTGKAATSLQTTAGLLKKHASGQRFEVAGYTDSMGSPRRNQQISEQRAETVRNFLIRQGIKANLLISKGYGQDDPIADNKSQTGRAMNRRVELHQLTAE